MEEIQLIAVQNKAEDKPLQVVPSSQQQMSKYELVSKVIEFASCSVIEAKAALFDCNSNWDEAINIILDKPLQKSCEKIFTKSKISELEVTYSKVTTTTISASDEDEPSPSTSKVHIEPKAQSVVKVEEIEAVKCIGSKVVGKELTQNYADEFMLDRIVQDYLAEQDDAQELANHFDYGWNRDLRTSMESRPTRGGKPYTKPYGCMRYAISVVGKYPPNDNWLGGNGVPNEEEWPVAYHGTQEVNVLDIMFNGFDLKKAYASDYCFEKRKFKLILQCRVNPKKCKTVAKAQFAGVGEYWLVPNGEAIRPYAICVYDQKAASNVLAGIFPAVKPQKPKSDPNDEQQPSTSKAVQKKTKDVKERVQ
uniref:Uncharacterized protein n=1 Tax=Ditylenchus dipsaci TaxID=166011 RepID=A0A915DP57_9BILA